jgi:hypothetical protein
MPKRKPPKKNLQDYIHEHWVLIGITLLAFLVRIYFFKNNQVEDGQDSYVLASLSKNILMQGEYEIRGRFIDYIQPLYPLLVALLTLITRDFFLSGKIISLVSGVAAIPVVYLLWKKLESKEVALISSFLFAFNHAGWYYGIHTYRDSLFLFLSALAFLLLFLARDDKRWLIWLSIVLGLATLTRGEGYLLAVSFALAYFYWERGVILKITKPVAIYLLIAAPWQIYKYTVTGSLIPEKLVKEASLYGHMGLNWINSIVMSLSPVLVLFLLLGIFLSRGDYKKYLPFYLFVLIFSLAHMWSRFRVETVRYTMPLLPIFLGFAAVGIWAAVSKIKSPDNYLKYLILMVAAFGYLGYNGELITPSTCHEDIFEVVKDVSTWIDENTAKGDVIAVGSPVFYEYYVDREIMDTGRINDYLDYSDNPMEAFFGFLIHENVSYFVAFDSLSPSSYSATRFLAMEFDVHTYNSQGFKINLVPVGKFEKNCQTVYLYKVEKMPQNRE